ncbi:hypothetical protein FA95DRAFT_915027 [Auriscalpium vulgare]|uniref:Uncharacterized protein n=1 Tax=Auriscalpium vulgare TaxID=40419 RepID=A0ACB8R7W1_9AGAM|nr:hypothetical protein FA95DRAFT_915027 [Auriscalpium vulgare]
MSDRLSCAARSAYLAVPLAPTGPPSQSWQIVLCCSRQDQPRISRIHCTQPNHITPVQPTYSLTKVRKAFGRLHGGRTLYAARPTTAATSRALPYSRCSACAACVICKCAEFCQVRAVCLRAGSAERSSLFSCGGSRARPACSITHRPRMTYVCM